MQVKRYKLIAAVVAALMIVMSLGACGGQTQETQQSQQTVQPTQAAGTTQESLEPITLKMMVGYAVTQCQEGINDLPVFNEIKKKTGITLDIVKVDKEKLKVIAAGGDLPDLIELQESGEMASTLISSGAVLPLDNLLEKYGQNIKKVMPVALKWSKDILGNGTTYFLPVATSKADSNNPGGNGYVGFFTRFDVYKAIGAPEMSGEDDFLKVLKQMQDYQPKTKDGKKVYGLSAWADGGLWPYIICYPQSYGYTNMEDFAQINLDDGTVENSFIDPEGIFWEGIKFFNKAYRMGVFDIEGLTQKNAQYAAKVANGEVLSGHTPWWPVDPKLTNDLAFLTALPGAFPVISGVYGTDSLLGYSATDARAISADCKYPERAMQLLDFFDSDEGSRLILNGVQGEDWDLVDGKPQLIGEMQKATETGNIEYLNKRGIRAFWLWCSGVHTAADGFTTDIATGLDIKIKLASAAQKNFAQYYDSSLSFPGQVYDKWVKEGKAKTNTSVPLGSQLIAPKSDTTTQTLNKASQYMQSNMSKFILSKSDSEFDAAKKKAIDDMIAMGADKAYQEVQANLKKANEQVAKFTN